MSEGNPGALNVCINLLKEGERIDPDSMLGGIGPILALDSLGIYGSRIWILYKYICNQSLVLTIAVLRAVQLGFLKEETLKTAIEPHGREIEPLTLYNQVKERLPRFADLEPAEADTTERVC
jgi:hypothetical protein